MKSKRLALRSVLIPLCAFALPSAAFCQPAPAKALPAPQTYTMSLVLLADAPSARHLKYIFVINGAVGYQSVASLELGLKTLDPGSVLKWMPSDARTGDEPLLSSEAAMKDFRAYCAARKIKFVLVPEG